MKLRVNLFYFTPYFLGRVFSLRIQNTMLSVTLLKQLLNYETILISMMLLAISEVSSPVSKYLQPGDKQNDFKVNLFTV